MTFSALVLVVGCSLMLQGVQAQLIFKPVNIVCDGNPLRMNNLSCVVKAINWNLALINMTADLLTPIRNVIMRLQVLKKDYANHYKPFLIDVTINLCQVIERKNFTPYGVIVYKLLKQYTNVNHTCPFAGRLFMRDGYLDKNLMPPFPEGFYLFSFQTTDQNSTTSAHIANVKFYFEVREMVKSKKKSKA